MIVGLAGYRGAGKSHLAHELVRDYRLTKMSYADPVRSAAAAAWGVREEVFTDRRRKDVENYVFSGKTPRDVLIELGMWYRSQNPDHWVNVMRRRAEGMHVVIDDVRFINEFELCDVCLWVDMRPGNPSEEDEPELESIRSSCITVIGPGPYSERRRNLEDYIPGLRRLHRSNIYL